MFGKTHALQSVRARARARARVQTKMDVTPGLRPMKLFNTRARARARARARWFATHTFSKAFSFTLP